MTACDFESDGVDVDGGDTTALSMQHGCKRAPGAADNENVAGVVLTQKILNGMGVDADADAMPIGLTVKTSVLKISKSPISRRSGDADNAVSGGVLFEKSHESEKRTERCETNGFMDGQQYGLMDGNSMVVHPFYGKDRT